jgi:hypothetical protein
MEKKTQVEVKDKRSMHLVQMHPGREPRPRLPEQEVVSGGSSDRKR